MLCDFRARYPNWCPDLFLNDVVHVLICERIYTHAGSHLIIEKLSDICITYHVLICERILFYCRKITKHTYA